jgi:DNA-binding CsgD family transcriptional regulator
VTRGRNDESWPLEPKPLSAHEAGKLASRTQETSDASSAAPTPTALVGYIGGAALIWRQRQVLELMSNGLTNQQISEEIGREIGTVDKHIENLFKKLKVRSRADAVIVFLRREIRDLLRERARLVRQKRRLVLQKEALRKENKALRKENTALTERLE